MELRFSIENDNLTLSDDAGQFNIPLFSINPLHLFCELPPQQVIDSFLKNINRYGEVVKYTYGLTTLLDVIAISSLVYRKLTCEKYRNLRALEIGSWFGCSTVFTALALRTFSDDNILFCMDTWKGTENEGNAHEIANYENALEHFRAVMRFMGVSEQVKPIVCDSILGMEALRDNYYDIIFIDAAHNYKNVRADILNAIRLIRPGGLIMGHDCTCKMSQLPGDIKTGIASMDDPVSVRDYTVGVIKALHDIFGENYEHFAPSLVWYKTITKEDKKRILSSNLSDQRKMIIDMSNSVMKVLNTMNCDKLNCENLELLNDIIQTIDRISSFFKSNFTNLQDREVKSTTMLLKDYIVNIVNAIQNSSSNVAKKYFKKAISLQRKLHMMIKKEFDF